MILNFTLSESDCIALTEEYLSNSLSHQRSRTRLRWLVPTVLSILLAMSYFRNGFDIPMTLLLCGGIFGWLFFYPAKFDARVRKHALAQMQDQSYAQNFGDYRIQISDKAIKTTGPTGESEYTGAAIDRVALTPDYLFVFFAGLSGLPISVQQIGENNAQSAHELLSRLSHRNSPRQTLG